MRENTDQKILRVWTLFTQCQGLSLWNILKLWNFKHLNFFSSNCFNRNCFDRIGLLWKKGKIKRKIFFPARSQKFSDFSNLKKFMSIKCKNAAISSKNLFYRSTANNMQNSNIKCKVKKMLWKVFYWMHYSFPNYFFFYFLNFVPGLNLIGCTITVRETHLWSNMTLWTHGFECSRDKLKA